MAPLNIKASIADDLPVFGLPLIIYAIGYFSVLDALAQNSNDLTLLSIIPTGIEMTLLTSFLTEVNNPNPTFSYN